MYEDHSVGCAHSSQCASDPDLVLVDRDLPPLYRCGGGNGATNRRWKLRLSTGEDTPLNPRDPHRCRVHPAWSWDEGHVVYHSWRREGRWSVGVTTTSGAEVEEYAYPEAAGYEQVAAAPDRQAVILDCSLTAHNLIRLFWESPSPRTELIDGLRTDWSDMKGQSGSPNPTTGRWICCNSARHGRSGVLVIDTKRQRFTWRKGHGRGAFLAPGQSARLRLPPGRDLDRLVRWLASRDRGQRVAWTGSEIMNSGARAAAGIEALLDWLSTHHIDPATGVWGAVDTANPLWRSHAVQAAYHGWPLYLCDGRPFEYGHPELSSPAAVGAMFPTWFRLLSPAYVPGALPSHPLAQVRWPFVRCPGVQFWCRFPGSGRSTAVGTTSASATSSTPL